MFLMMLAGVINGGERRTFANGEPGGAGLCLVLRQKAGISEEPCGQASAEEFPALRMETGIFTGAACPTDYT